MRRGLVLLIFWVALAGFMSGSSTVFIRGEYYLLAAESVRKIFAMGRGEQSWHRNWSAEHQQLLEEGLRPAIAGVLDSLRQQPERFADSVQAVAALLLPIDPQLSLYPHDTHGHTTYRMRDDSTMWAEWRKTGTAGYYMAEDLFEVHGRSWAVLHLARAPLKNQARALDSLLRSRLRPANKAWYKLLEKKREEEAKRQWEENDKD